MDQKFNQELKTFMNDTAYYDNYTNAEADANITREPSGPYDFKFSNGILNIVRG